MNSQGTAATVLEAILRITAKTQNEWFALWYRSTSTIATVSLTDCAPNVLHAGLIEAFQACLKRRLRKKEKENGSAQKENKAGKGKGEGEEDDDDDDDDDEEEEEEATGKGSKVDESAATTTTAAAAATADASSGGFTTSDRACMGWRGDKVHNFIADAMVAYIRSIPHAHILTNKLPNVLPLPFPKHFVVSFHGAYGASIHHHKCTRVRQEKKDKCVSCDTNRSRINDAFRVRQKQREEEQQHHHHHQLYQDHYHYHMDGEEADMTDSAKKSRKRGRDSLSTPSTAAAAATGASVPMDIANDTDKNGDLRRTQRQSIGVIQ